MSASRELMAFGATVGKTEVLISLAAEIDPQHIRDAFGTSIDVYLGETELPSPEMQEQVDAVSETARHASAGLLLAVTQFVESVNRHFDAQEEDE